VTGPMIFTLRISLPDRPGTLGMVASSFGKGDVNILTLDVVDRADGTAVDDLRVEAPRGMQEALRRAGEAVPGFAVEYVRPLEAFGHVLEPLELAALLEDSGADALGLLVEHLPDSLGASWAIVAEVPVRAGEAPRVLAGSLGAPSAGRLLPAWLEPLSGTGSGDEGPAWSVPAPEAGGLEVATARLEASAVVLGRERGPTFRAAEVRHLGLLARIAGAVVARSGGLVQAI
jgi:hypothetical protein